MFIAVQAAHTLQLALGYKGNPPLAALKYKGHPHLAAYGYISNRMWVALGASLQRLASCPVTPFPSAIELLVPYVLCHRFQETQQAIPG